MLAKALPKRQTCRAGLLKRLGMLLSYPMVEASTPSPVEQLFEQRVIVCAGCGGVGKTSVAAALSVAAARAGRKVLTLTIDPAKRLADSLGVDRHSAERQYLPPERLAQLGIPARQLSVMMLDPGRTFVDLIDRLAPTREAAEAIERHPLFRFLVDYLAGTNEYMAMEKVLSVLEGGDFDLLVLDTPPTRHALDFLNAPERLTGAIDNPVMRAVARAMDETRRFGLDWIAKSASVVIRGLGRLTGAGMLEQVAGLIAELNSVFGGFRQRAEAVSAAFRNPDFGYLLVTRPYAPAIEDTVYFAHALRERGMRPDWVVVNRVHAELAQEAVLPCLERVELSNATLAQRLWAVVREQQVQREYEQSQLTRLHEDPDLSAVPMLELPVIRAGISDLAALDEFAVALQNQATRLT